MHLIYIYIYHIKLLIGYLHITQITAVDIISIAFQHEIFDR